MTIAGGRTEQHVIIGFVMHDCQAVLISKMLPEKNRVLIKVLRVEKVRKE